jgi:hypothetical protein
MPDTWDTGVNNPSSLPPLTAAVIAAHPKTILGGVVGPCASDKTLRATLDAIHALAAPHHSGLLTSHDQRR